MPPSNRVVLIMHILGHANGLLPWPGRSHRNLHALPSWDVANLVEQTLSSCASNGQADRWTLGRVALLPLRTVGYGNLLDVNHLKRLVVIGMVLIAASFGASGVASASPRASAAAISTSASADAPTRTSASAGVPAPPPTTAATPIPPLVAVLARNALLPNYFEMP